MKGRTNWLRGVLAGAVIIGAAAVPAFGAAQANSVLRFNPVIVAGAGADSVITLFQHRYRADEWRTSHPNWNGHYYYHGGGYYYDRGWKNGAIIDNDWGDIAVGNGGVSVGVGDPYLYFNGSRGSWYPTAQLNVDLGGTGIARARAGYFSKPYFYRQGTRYDSVSGTHNGVSSYRFVRRSR